MLSDKLLNKKEKIAVIGLGYVGLPIALSFATKTSVIGYDISSEHIEKLREREDPNNEIDFNDYKKLDINFTNNPENLAEALIFIITVPTPVDEGNRPDLKTLLIASETVGKYINNGNYVIYESTVYPGCTEDECIPILEKVSGLRLNKDFFVGYSPERINPGDSKHTLSKITKVVSASSKKALDEIAEVYKIVVEADIHKTSSIKIAEAAKIIENTQRDINIALINELSIIFNRMDINTYEVLDAANTKWNFLPFKPGLVGGHCVGVDPYYLTYKAKKVGYHSKVITSGRYVNDSMGFYIGKQTVKKLIAQGVNVMDAKVLIMGMTFKENISDIRNSKVLDVVKELKSFAVAVDVIDDFADSSEVKKQYDIDLIEKPDDKYDAVIVAVNHSIYYKYDENYFQSLMKNKKGLLVDVKGIYRGKINKLDYWSL